MPSHTIAFVHGAFVNRDCWKGWVLRCAARGYACVPIAYPGRERSVAELRDAPDPDLAALTLEAVIEHHVRMLRALDEKPLIVGHSTGGLLTQLMLQRDLGSAGVAIDSVPPQGVLSLAWSFLRSLRPVLDPLVPLGRTYLMSPAHFAYSFANDLLPAEQAAAYEELVVPESRRLARGALTRAARVDFARPRAPLLMIAGERDHIMPASLNRRNCARSRRSPSITAFKEFPGRALYSILAGRGWEEVADSVLEWAVSVGALAPTPQRSLARR
jgi:pimeloyl-ACP methyl ester carboxylesterase